MKTLIKIFIILIFFTNSIYSFDIKPEKLSLELKTNKKYYLNHEKIILQIEALNKTKSTIQLPPDYITTKL